MAENAPKVYKYYDTPDGEDCMKKLVYVTKLSSVTGLFASTIDILLYSHPKGYGAMLGRYAYVTLPLMGIGAAFTATACAATNIRKKDDKVNYILAGFAAGGVWGAWQKSYKIGSYGGIALAVLGILMKDSYQNNWNVLTSNPIQPKIHTNPYWVRQDWSIVSDPGKTSSKE